MRNLERMGEIMMSGLDREDLIKSLASAMGMEDKNNNNDMQNRYNSSTGTIFCNKKSLNNATVAANRMAFGAGRA